MNNVCLLSTLFHAIQLENFRKYTWSGSKHWVPMIIKDSKTCHFINIFTNISNSLESLLKIISSGSWNMHKVGYIPDYSIRLLITLRFLQTKLKPFLSFHINLDFLKLSSIWMICIFNDILKSFIIIKLSLSWVWHSKFYFSMLFRNFNNQLDNNHLFYVAGHGRLFVYMYNYLYWFFTYNRLTIICIINMKKSWNPSMAIIMKLWSHNRVV